MSGKKPVEMRFRRFFLFGLPSLLFLFSAIPFFFRDLWFDEALTLLNFALLPSAEKIYFSYVIPNNQILHTVFLHLWIHGFGVDFLRLFPLLTALALLAGLASFRSRLGRSPLLIAMTALALSPAFLLYGTAIRGYMLSALFSLLACRAACGAVQTGKKRAWIIYFLSSFCAAGTMPGALAALAGGALYASAFSARKRTLFLLFFLPVFAFCLFYAPIAPALLRCAALKEGWQSGSGVLLAVGSTLTALFFVLLIPAGIGALLKRKKRRMFLRGGIFLLIPAAAWILHPAPFPRVFFPLFPLFALLAAGGLRRFFAFLRHRNGKGSVRKAFFLLFGVTLLWGGITQTVSFRQFLGQWQCVSGQDDFWDPAFLRPDFQPAAAAVLLRTKFPGGNFPLYLSFASDPWAVMAGFALTPGTLPRFYFDGPQGRIGELPPGTVVLLRKEEDPETVRRRFRRPVAEIGKTTMHRIFRLL